ncbi:MAG TPA: twin-arginine translocase TatA/TatE family subunit [Armatimonadetes bacterium]|nr:twin-arginine translocase TatA/TatE family subunit [Armatimonadota bacterium]
MFGTLGPQEILIIFLFILLLFGARRIPELARALGKGIKEFRRATTELVEDITEEEPEERKPRRRPHAREREAEPEE